MNDKAISNKDAVLSAGAQINAALAPLEPSEVYALVSGFHHRYFDLVDESEMRMLVLFTVTHALEARDAQKAGREPCHDTYDQLSRWADVKSDADGVNFTVTFTATMDHSAWDAAARRAKR